MSLLLVFLDGVGLGPATDDNPLAAHSLPAFSRLAGGSAWTRDTAPTHRPGHVFSAIDATLGFDGLPQSGTGQATLFTGENAARLHGRHFGPYPPTTVRPTVSARSMFAQLIDVGYRAEQLAFANAFPDRFFRSLEGRGRWTVTTLAAHSAGVRLRRAADLRAGRALAADLTGASWQRLFDASFSPITEADAARQLAALLDDHAFVLHEYFLTDKAGHSQDMERAIDVLASLDRFFASLIEALRPQDLLLVTSDHGNIEDLGTKSHTRHPVPLIAWGQGAETFATARSLLDITPQIVRLLTP